MTSKKLSIDEATLRQTLEAFRGLREWIKAVPDDTPLPAMPGIVSDWLDEVEHSLVQALEAEGQQDPEQVHEWIFDGCGLVKRGQGDSLRQDTTSGWIKHAESNAQRMIILPD